MLKPSLCLQTRRLAAILAVCLCAAGPAYPQDPSPAAKPAQTPAQPDAKANDAFLAKAATLYYSPAKAGLNAFNCDVHPDWRALFLSANKGSAVAADDPRIVLLQTVNITLHGRLKGGSAIDWNPPPVDPAKPLDQDSSALIDNMQKATDQTLQGFMQFWTPFVDGSAVPASSDGLVITQNEKGEHTLRADQAGTSVTEVMDVNNVLTHFNVVMSGATVNFSPSYKHTEKGLLVSGFLANILPAGTPADQAQEMHVGIDYQTMDGFYIPSRLNMEVVGTGIFNFTMDGCKVNP